MDWRIEALSGLLSGGIPGCWGEMKGRKVLLKRSLMGDRESLHPFGRFAVSLDEDVNVDTLR